MKKVGSNGRRWVPMDPGCPLVPAGAARESAEGRPGWRGCRCAKTIENISRIKMVVARASRTLMASSLKQTKFLTQLLLRWRNSARAPSPPGRCRKNETIIRLLFRLRNFPPSRTPPTSAGRGMIQKSADQPMGRRVVNGQLFSRRAHH